MSDETMWFKLKEGERWRGTVDVSDEMWLRGEERALLFAERPDWVRYPVEVSKAFDGKSRGRVVKMAEKVMTCPTCKDSGLMQEIETVDGVCVCACPICKKYSWYRRAAVQEKT